jgi:hypothetical protein
VLELRSTDVALRLNPLGLLLAAPTAWVVAQPQLVEVPLPTREVLVRQLVAPPASFIELCTEVKATRPIAWAFEAARPLTFNTHVHVAGEVKLPETMSTVMAARGRLVPDADRAYCWLWSNRYDAPVTVRVRLGP